MPLQWINLNDRLAWIQSFSQYSKIRGKGSEGWIAAAYKYQAIPSNSKQIVKFGQADDPRDRLMVLRPRLLEFDLVQHLLQFGESRWFFLRGGLILVSRVGCLGLLLGCPLVLGVHEMLVDDDVLVELQLGVVEILVHLEQSVIFSVSIVHRLICDYITLISKVITL